MYIVYLFIFSSIYLALSAYISVDVMVRTTVVTGLTRLAAVRLVGGAKIRLRSPAPTGSASTGASFATEVTERTGN